MASSAASVGAGSVADVVRAGAVAGQRLDEASVAATLQVLQQQRRRRHHKQHQRRTRFVIGSRESELALIQSRHVCALLRAKFPGLEFVIQTSSSAGGEWASASQTASRGGKRAH